MIMNAKKLFSMMLLMLMAFSYNAMMAQQMPPIPVDEAVRIGKLDNGLTYYIRQNNYPEHRANFYIAQRVGAMQEEDDQNGLAHFLEHMAFNGSEHFNGEGNGILDYTRSLGLSFGGDLNAYTSYTQTVYHINDVPCRRQSALDSCLLILRDWSHGLQLTDEEIEKERGVIHEEWRMGQGPGERMRNRQMETLFPGSKYAKRNIIGLMEIVDNFPPQVLRDYYDKWYRPDNQAIIIVGDVDVDHTEAKIKELFNDLPKPAPDAAQVVKFPVPDNEEPIVAIDKDKEQQYSTVSVMFKHDPIEDEDKGTINYIIDGYVKSLIYSMFASRFSEKVQEPDCPYLQAYAYDGGYMSANTKAAFTMSCTPKEGMVEAATEAMVTEATRALKYGFTATEFARAQDKYMSFLEQWYNQRDKVYNDSYGSDYCSHFLSNEPIPSVEQYYTIMSQIAPMIQVEHINRYLPELIRQDDKNLVVVNYNQEKDDAVYPTKEGLLAAINAARNADIAPYVDNVKQEPLISKLPKKGKIVKERENTTFGYKELELSNGARVILKPTDFKQDEIILNSFQRGGKSLYGEEDWMNLYLLSAINNVTGLGEFSSTELSKALAGKQVWASLGVSNLLDGVNGSSTVKDLETMFQLVYLKFTAINKDEKKFNQYMSQMESMLKNKDLQPESALSDSMQYIMSNYNWRSKPVRVEDLQQVNLDRMVQIARERTANAANYTFTIIGSFDEATVRPLIEQYIASLPAKKGVKSNWKDDVTTPKGECIKHFTHKMETPKYYEVVVWHDDEVIPYSLENSIKANILGQILTRIYLQKIREDSGAAYSVFAQGSSSRDGDRNSTAVFAICPVKPEFKDEALRIINEEMVNACTTIDPVALKEAQENMLKDFATNIKENYYWRSVIQSYLIYGLDEHTGYEDLVKAQTPESIADFARQLMATGNRIEIVMTPEETENQ